MTNGRARRQGLIDNLLDRPARGVHRPDASDVPATTDSKYDVVATVTDGGDHQVAAQRVAEATRAHPDVKCVVGLFGYSGPAIAEGLKQTKPPQPIKVIGFGELAEALVRSGVISASIVQAQHRCGYSLVQVTTDLLHDAYQNGPAGPRLVDLPVLVMHADNIAELRAIRVIRNVDDATAAGPTTAPAKP